MGGRGRSRGVHVPLPSWVAPAWALHGRARPRARARAHTRHLEPDASLRGLCSLLGTHIPAWPVTARRAPKEPRRAPKEPRRACSQKKAPRRASFAKPARVQQTSPTASTFARKAARWAARARAEAMTRGPAHRASASGLFLTRLVTMGSGTLINPTVVKLSPHGRRALRQLVEQLISLQ